VFDYIVTRNNPAGGCHLRILRGLCLEHEFTVFAAEFENPNPSRIRWIKVPVIRRPMPLLFITFHICAPIFYWIDRLSHGKRFDLVQVDGCCLLFGDLSYSHFCNKTYMKYHWKETKTRGLRGIATALTHWLHVLAEPVMFRKAKQIVAPSRGLAREISVEFPTAASKVQIIHNAVEVGRMRAAEDFDRDEERRKLGIAPTDLAIVFVSLGHFERKGLPQLLEALTQIDASHVKLIVVGGMPYLLSEYEKIVEQMDLSSRVRFLGMKDDVRPYLWCADLFALPSFYEVFPLVALEAAAAGLPLLVSPLNGVEEFLVDGENGFVVAPTSTEIARGIERCQSLSPKTRKAMGVAAQRSVSSYTGDAFIQHWRMLYSADGFRLHNSESGRPQNVGVGHRYE
jgi:glycosyltransferase involved in cell wall biosynthesis